MFNTGLIDSLKIRIKLDKVQIIDKRLVEDFIEYYPNIQQLDNDTEENGYELKKAKPLTKIINGVTYRIYVKAFIGQNKQANEYVVLQVSAKMLLHQYFEGITKNNIDVILNNINSLGIIRLTKETLLDGLVSDIDICINQLIDEKSLKSAFGFIRNFPAHSKKPLIHFISQSQTNGSRNLGIDFNKREKATNSTPYCKIYHKGFELLSKSVVFYNSYLSPMRSSVIDNLVRYEFTIKASKHKEYLCKKGFKADFKTFGDLLNTKPKELLLIAQSGLKHYLEKQTKSKIDTNQKPTEIVLQYYIENLINLGFDTEKLLGFTYLIDCPVSRSTTKTRVKKLVSKLTADDNQKKRELEQNNRTNNFLKNLGYENPF
jgi:hypothetical protein